MYQKVAGALAALGTEMRERAGPDPNLAPFAELMTQPVGAENPALPQAAPDHPARAHLAAAMAGIAGVADRTASAFQALQGDLRWRQVFDGAGAPPTIAEGMLAAQIAGPVGLANLPRGCAGLFMIAPDVHYPLHTHEAEEIYLCLHGSLTLQYGTAGAPAELTPGAYGYTRSHRVHSLTTGAEPALLAYIWSEPLDRPNWIWQDAPGGGWIRARWTRREDGSWARVAEEPVTGALLAEADGD